MLTPIRGILSMSSVTLPDNEALPTAVSAHPQVHIQSSKAMNCIFIASSFVDEWPNFHATFLVMQACGLSES